MNIEFETRKIISEGFTNGDKVKLIQGFSNFKRENILYALNKRYERIDNLSGQVYYEIVKREIGK